VEDQGRNKRHILLRADGNQTTGLGHLYRLFALVEMLQDEYQCTFLTSENSVTKIIPDYYNVQFVPGNVNLKGEPSWLMQQFNPDDHIIIADGYGFDSNYQKALHESGFRLVYIDDLSTEHMYADLVVNHAIGATEEQFSTEPYTQFALGTTHAILRPEFLDAAAKRREAGQIKRVFVCFGGADPNDHTHLFVKTLLSFEEIQEIDVVLGAAYPHREIFQIAKENNVRIHRNINASQLVVILESCQLGIVPSSTILYEVCAVKMPVISGYYVDNQKGIYDGFLSRQAIVGLGNMNTCDAVKIRKSLEGILNQENLQSYVDKQAQLFDNQIKNRFLEWIEKLN